MTVATPFRTRLTRHLAAAAVLFGLGLAAPAGPARADGDGFDYWVLSLSWSPAWCAAQDAAGQDGGAQCAPGAARGFTVHGLWPQYERGWPEFCPTVARPPSRADSAGMAGLMGSAGLAFYQWRKHGVCSGLSGPDYYGVTRQAAAAITLPPVLAAIDRPLRIGVPVIEDAFIEANPALTRDAITVTCRAGTLQEVRICLDRTLRPRDCAPDIARDCSRDVIDLPAPR